MGRFDGRIAIVTGGASGIGAATMRRLAAEGATVVCADIDDAKGTHLVAELSAAGATAAFQHCDVGELAQLEHVVAFARQEFGGLDVIHNNAIWSSGGWVHEIDPDGWDRSLRIMLTAVFYGCRAAIPAFLERGRGAIVNTASVEAFGGEMQAAPYTTAKAGVVNLTRQVAIEYGRVGIRCNAIAPGVVDTPLLQAMLHGSARSRDEIAALHALGRIIDPAEIAAVVAFLASDDASAITGTTITVDAGLTAHVNIGGRSPYGA